MSEFEPHFENKNNLEEKNKIEFTKKYPSLKDLADNANFIGSNYLETNNFDLVKNSKEKAEGSKVGSHREVLFYNDYVFKSPQNISAKVDMKIQENEIPKNSPIVRYVGVVKDTETSKEYLIEPEGTQFDRFYLNSHKDIDEKVFDRLFKEFVSSFDKIDKIPLEFSVSDLNNHLLVFLENNKLVLKMTDVDRLRNIKYRGEIEDIVNNYFDHLQQLSKSETPKETDLSSQELQNKLHALNIRNAIHDFIYIIAPIQSYADYSSLGLSKKEYVDLLDEALNQVKENKDRLFNAIDSNVRPIAKELDKFEEYKNYMIKSYDQILDKTNTIIKGDIQEDILKQIKELTEKIIKEIKQTWEYVKDEYNPIANSISK